MEMKDFSLEGKVALVTGASYGIGFAIAEGMAKAGATIVFNDIRQELVDKGLAAYKEAGVEAHGYVCDVTDEDAVQAMVKQIAAGSGRHRHSGEQRGHHQAHPDVRDDGGAVPAGGGRGPERAVHREQGGDPGDDRKGARKDHQHLQHDERAGPRDGERVCGCKGRPEDADEEHCQRVRRIQHPVQRHRAGIHRDAADGAAAGAPGGRKPPPVRPVHHRKDAGGAVGHHRRTLWARRCSLPATLPTSSTAMCCMWTAASWPTSASSRSKTESFWNRKAARPVFTGRAAFSFCTPLLPLSAKGTR